MSIWKSLFGGGNSKAATTPAGPAAREDYNGFMIEATPLEDGGHYLVSGVISKTIDGERKEHRFIRADRCPSLESAAEMSIRKGMQIVDQMGDGVFRQQGG